MTEVNPKVCSAAVVPWSRSTGRVWGQLQVVKHCAKAYSSSREEGSTHGATVLFASGSAFA